MNKITKYGMAVNADGSMMAVSYTYPLHQVHVFRLTPLEQVRMIGREGAGPAEFGSPRRLCFTDKDNILVCDFNNNRVQQLTYAGEYLSSFSVQGPFSIAAHSDMVAVGCYDGPIEIHSLATGEMFHRFGLCGDGTGQIHTFATGIRFTPDGACLLVAECSNHWLSMFTVDGVFMKRIGVGVLDDGFNDVSYGAGGEIIVADFGNHRVCVLSPNSDTLIKTWGSEGTVAGQFRFPTSLAVSGSYLYVMDGSHVQVFE